ncbi:MAG: DUF3135 domain-containing protein [Deltaproteobacteria bacterium]|nr:DUF3135 domain-containing protein [Deltaproteobacteria bacterium]MBW2066684.1 DUF3135 domain-containing protein [Deltaproteobacteria bacterium]
MNTGIWSEEKEKRRSEALEMHEMLSRLFREDRLAFEREKKKMIHKVINGVEDEERKQRLLAFQESWDNRMKAAGSSHNRFLIAQAIFWEHFHGKWHPVIKEFRRLMGGRTD